MKKTMLIAGVLVAFVALPATKLSAQVMGRDSRPGNDVLSVNVVGGGFFSADNLAPGTEFKNTGSVGGSVTYWAHTNVGLRADLLWAGPTVRAAQDSPLAGEDPNVWHYSGDVVLRMPLTGTSRMSWFPYIVGGVGAKTYDFQTLATATDFAGNVGAGLELRFGETGRIGINTEIRDAISNFKTAGYDQTLNDVVWTGGLTLNY